MCAYFFKNPGSWSLLAKTCTAYCMGKGFDFDQCDWTVHGDTDFETDFDKSTIQQDENGDPWVPSPCKCEDKMTEEAGEIIVNVLVKALENIDSIFCVVWLSAFQTVIDLGISAVPGGQALQAIKMAVKGAKTFAENGQEAASFFGDWVGFLLL